MSVYTEVELCCDGAGGPFDCDTPPIFAKTGVAARIEARSSGWLVGVKGGKDFCPQHRPAGRTTAEVEQ